MKYIKQIIRNNQILEQYKSKRAPFESDFENRILPLRAYFLEFGTIADIKSDDVLEFNGEQVSIGSLVVQLRRELKARTLSPSQIEILDYMDMNWGFDIVVLLDLVKKVYKSNLKKLNNYTQCSKIEVGGKLIEIGECIRRLRLAKKHNQLTMAQISFLEMLGMVWAPKQYEVVYAPLIAYAEENGGLQNIKTMQLFEFGGKEVNVGRQVNHLRGKYHEGLLSQEVISFFEGLGLSWTVKERKTKDVLGE